MKRITSATIILSCMFFFTIPAAWGQLDPGPWPMFHHDARHTGLSPYEGPSAPALNWSYRTGDEVFSSPAIGSDGGIYVGSVDNRIYALNSAGSFQWSYRTGLYVYSSPAIGSDGGIYVGSQDNRIYALNSAGSLNWSYLTGDSVQSSPSIGSDGGIYAGSWDNRIYALSSAGSFQWSYLTGNKVERSPAIGSDGGIYASSSGGDRIYALSSAGSFQWSYLAGDSVRSSPVIGSDGWIYAGSYDRRLYALSSAGSLQWSYLTGYHVSASPAIGSDGWIYAGSYDNRIYALSSAGSFQWSYQTRSSIVSSPAMGSDGRIYVGTPNNRIYALSSAGSFQWSYLTGDIVYSSPAIGSDGRIYVGSYDSRLYCLGAPPRKLAIMKKEGAGDINLYYYNSLVQGDWVYWDAKARNPSQYARDLWVIPVGNDAIGMTSIGGASPDRLYVLKEEGAADVNLYLYESLVGGDWVYWDAKARNPSPLARDLWVMPSGNDAIAIATVDDITGDGNDDLAILKKEGADDVNLYYYNALVAGDWVYWDAKARNPSAVARDLWVIPAGNDAVGMAAIDVGGGVGTELAIIRKEGVNDLNLYIYNNLVPGDWVYWDAKARNPSAMARDLWVMPSGSDAIGLAAMDADGDSQDELVILKKEGIGDVNLYYYNTLVPGDWVYWDAKARNPSPMARDLWVMPSGNDAIGMTAIRAQ